MKHYTLSLVLLLFLISSCSTLTESVDNNTLPETYEPIESNSNRFERDRAATQIRQPQFHQPQIVTATTKQKQAQASKDKKESILERQPFIEEIFPIIFTKQEQVPSQIRQPQFSTPLPKKLIVKKRVKHHKKLIKFKRKKIKRQKKLLKFKPQKQKPVKSYKRLVKRHKRSVKPYKRLVKRHKKPVKRITRDQYQQRHSLVMDPAPLLNLTDILSNYRLGKSDLIDIKVFSEKDLSMKVRLSEEGIISYPFLGELDLADLTVNEVEKLVSSGLDGDYLIDPKVTVAILEYRQLFVNGETKKPGGYDFVPGMTVNKAISLAGGFTERASRDEIFIIRDGDEAATALPAKLDTYIGPGDIINIKQYQKFFVDGEVKKAGSYNFLHGLTVSKAISMAGGFTEKASRNEIVIIPKNKSEIAANLNMPVKPGDIIMVKQYKKFFVDGEVKNPSGYEYLNGITVKKAISMAGGFTEKADRETILLVYQGAPNTQYLVDINMNLEPGDIITIKEYQKFFVGGEVKTSGAYNYMPGLTIDTAISMAGGFSEKADREAILLSYQGKEQTQYLVDLNMNIEPGDIINIKAYQKFFVGGEVKNPGGYDYLPGQTVDAAISMAGGFTEKADRGAIFIGHQGNEQTLSLVNLYTQVKPGDIITIQEYQKFFVDGEVKNPGGYNYMRDMTVKTAISMAGGFTPNANREAIILDYQGNDQIDPIVDLHEAVKPGDIITIKPYQKIFVDGEVKNPAAYAYLRDLTVKTAISMAGGLTVKTAISMAGGFTEKSSREEIYIIHQGEEQTKIAVNLYTQVKAGDIITIQEYQKFFVDGEVEKPGDYVYLPGLTIKTAISMAGGFTEKAARGQLFIAHHGNEHTQTLSSIFSAVKPGDIITVKKYQKVFINGEVKNSGGYDFIPGLTVEKAISMAGGFTEYGSARWSKIYILPEKDQAGKAKRVKLSTPVYPGDVITIKESLF
ncbi:SLBB domain-containing protein [Candidatus Marithrix sp. Canyon 246]|uniref:SLBB domain-containing protein n=1 Tax=Candidatus Marithrix sp. Canyon 246 TaxID=1827136 RepID=UPI0009F272A3|nr:SLBB domain-containing protein [Candidatus Marithrix sp. Canyon 246]